MDIEIQLGSPRHNCDRFGICQMSALSQKAYYISEGKALANIRLEANNKISLRFYRKSITTSTFDKHFVNGYFTISATATPSGNIFEALGIAPFSLDAGQYQIKLTKCYAEVQITCSNAIYDADCVCASVMNSS
jgi:hypothetical protein